MPIDFYNLTITEKRDFEFLRERRLSQLVALLMEEKKLNF